MFLSIVIPIYKVEKYIRGTLDSIYCQNFNESDFEVIVVNDGTPDNSMEIVETFAADHANISIVNQENQGLSCARNSGLKIAKGDFIWFVDSDDKIVNGSLQKLKNLVSASYETEIWCFDITRVSEIDGIAENEKFILGNAKFNQSCFLQKYLFGLKTHMAPAQRFLFKNDFLKKNNLTFFPKIIHEDDEFMIRSVLAAKYVRYESYSPYLYLVRNGGNIMGSVTMKSLESKLKIIESWKSLAASTQVDCAGKRFVSLHIFNEMNSIVEKSHKVEGGSCLVAANKKLFSDIAFKCFGTSLFSGNFRKMMKSILVFIKLNMRTF